MSDNKLVKSQYSVFDKLDEKQIQEADSAVKQAMVYEAKGKREITYAGLKHIMLEMAHRNQPLELMESTCELQKDDPEDKTTWHWRSVVKVRNQSTRHESEGRSECDYFENGKYDSFGQRKAHSKAERNAWRKQIPELKIIELLKIATADQVQKVDTEEIAEGTTRACKCVGTKATIKDGKCTNCGGVKI